MKAFVFFLFLTYSFHLSAQTPTLKARYLVKKTYIPQNADKPTSITLDYEGIYLRKGSVYLSYFKPLYLDKYPTGSIEYGNQFNHKKILVVPTDSLNKIYHVNIDSLISRRHFGFPNQPSSGENYVSTFEKGSRDWQITTEKKIINGLECTKAMLNLTSDTIEVWFTPDIPAEVGPYGYVDAPGLPVTVWSPLLNETWTLLDVETGIELNDTDFWPAPFNKPFQKRPHQKSLKPTEPESAIK